MTVQGARDPPQTGRLMTVATADRFPEFGKSLWRLSGAISYMLKLSMARENLIHQ